jgi:S-adenosylmethionine hydrolase
MKAAVLAACPEARLVDISHAIAPFDVQAGSFVLWAGSQGFPAGTVHLAVVDPGVGGDRRALALAVGDAYFVGPDNGLFGWVVSRRQDAKAVALALPRLASPTFEGRDLFAPAAGRLAAGTPLAELGEAVEDLVVLPDLGPSVIWVDNFGNLVTNLEPPVGELRVNGQRVSRSARTYSEAQAGEPFWYAGSLGLIEIGVREGRADIVLGASPGTRIVVVPLP